MLKVHDFMFKSKIVITLSLFLFGLHAYGEEVYFESIQETRAYSWLPFEEHQRLQERVLHGEKPTLRFQHYFISDKNPYENFMGWKNSLIIYVIEDGFFLFDLSLLLHQAHYFNWLIERGRLELTVTEYVEQPGKKSPLKVSRELNLEELIHRRSHLLQVDRIDQDYLKEFHIGIIRDPQGVNNLLPVAMRYESLIFSDSDTVRTLVLQVVEEIRALSDGEEPQTQHMPKIIDVNRENFLPEKLENLLFGCLCHLLSFGAPEAADMFQDFMERGFFTSRENSYWYHFLLNKDRLAKVSPEGWVDQVTHSMRMGRAQRRVQKELARIYRARYGADYDRTGAEPDPKGWKRGSFYAEGRTSRPR